MNIGEFLRHSSLPEIQVTALYFKPKIPQEKLANAIREYAPEVGMSTVNVLIDESFWGNGKEGMIITNDKFILSKKLGNQEIPISSVKQIDIKEKIFIINDQPIAKFRKPELMPLGALGSKLSDFIATTQKNTIENQDTTLLGDTEKKKITDFLSHLTEPLYFESTPEERRKPGATTIGYMLASDINGSQDNYIRFKGGLYPNEEIICVSWLDPDSKDSFFCVSDRGIYSTTFSSPLEFISHHEIRGLNAVEEYDESRHVGLLLSNGQRFIVSVRNVFIRPYAYELFSGIIEILNGGKVEGRIFNDTPHGNKK